MLTSRKLIVPCSIRSSNRPGVAQTMSTPRGGFFALLAVADTAVDDRHAQIRETSVIAKSRLDLRGQLAGRLEHQTAEIAPCLASFVRIGSAKAAVLPVPVCAVPIRSLPARTIGKARS